MLVLSLCDRTGNMVLPWIEAGHDAVTVDLQRGSAWHGTRHKHLVADVTTLAPGFAAGIGASIVFAQPPCTDLAISGARYFRDKGLDALIDALRIVNACRKIADSSGRPWMLENPIGTLATYWREPDYSFDPCDYGDPYTKRTCLWIGGGFVMPPKIEPGDMFAEATAVEPTLGSLIYRMPDVSSRAERRSETPMGFARAVFAANAPRL